MKTSFKLSLLALLVTALAPLAAAQKPFALVELGGPGATIDSAEGGELASDVLLSPSSTGWWSTRPGKAKFKNIVLRVSPGGSDPLQQYITDVINGKFYLISGSYGFTDKPTLPTVSRYQFFNAAPVEITFPALDAASKDAAKISVSVSPSDSASQLSSLTDFGLTKLSPPNTIPQNRFTVEIDGVIVGGFKQMDAVRVSVGDLNGDGFADIVGSPLGFTVDATPPVVTALAHWRQTVVNGKVERKSVSVIFHNDAGEEAGRMNFFECWPVRYKGPQLNSVETTASFGLAYDRLEYLCGKTSHL